MKKIIIKIMFLGLIPMIFMGCNSEENNNRYSSMVVCNNSLYYYSDGYIYQYDNGNSTRVEKADSIFFSVRSNSVIEYYDEAPETKNTPYDSKLEGAIDIAFNENYVYARYPGEQVTIVVYSIDKTDSSSEELTQIDTIKL